MNRSGNNPAQAAELPSLRHRLSTRIVASALAALLVVLGMIGWTLWLSWQLEGAGAAINDAGSLRMRASRVGVVLLQAGPVHAAEARDDLAALADTLQQLQRGVPSRPLFLPAGNAIRAQMAQVRQLWQARLQPAAEHALAGGGQADYLAALPGFVAEADALVHMIEVDNAGKTTLLRLSQSVLIGIACIGTLAVIYLLYLWIISPVMQLQDGLRRMAAHEFGVRLPVESRDEFGVLAQGFNRMADELAELYRELEERVQRKTAQLAQQNRELGALYDMAAFLNQPCDIDALCRGFLQRVMRQFDADGGSIRVIDPLGEKLHLVVSEGLSEALEEAEHCMKIDACFCGEATREGVVVIRDFRKLPRQVEYNCAREGFKGLAVFRVVTGDEVLGAFSLHFRGSHEVPAAEAQLLETLGQHLGVALDNRRLGAKARQLAVAEERGLVAQGLHDSIAQGLNFLNLQLQMLDGAVARGDLGEIRFIAPMLRAGVDESYQDVRELLLNFRSKLGQGELRAAVEDTVARFRRQAGIEAALTINELDGAPLPPEQQLQVLFILQEALSNVRKHAQARHVTVQIGNHRDFELTIRDDGRGYDPAEVAGRGERHVGLHIMRERAARLHAVLELDARPGAGASVRLVLPQSERQVA
ncbi:type IV pili methyl-accepting chemotaxis transducer N-terminal domain-containing protein [Chitinimonas koreensis]|uniref:type IV pili methyl-accepting chemotaxis transducer N-terminal domain-containing protein n=1 Tax=Chitinimonas koreensis TaxID=356302 RepID=UPI00041A5975|nr:type IV pili methyl-accepting chemotaxis transducer N-terminal domain-containing protein [Chitinimonas koreensis]QNM95145.1 type IV pili methyl-accepting chemotaxis transducer N-terminal domain-containing protein [Chitinimonas koreensis]